jgi:hypothetical protein
VLAKFKRGKEGCGGRRSFLSGEVGLSSNFWFSLSTGENVYRQPCNIISQQPPHHITHSKFMLEGKFITQPTFYFGDWMGHDQIQRHAHPN